MLTCWNNMHWWLLLSRSNVHTSCSIAPSSGRLRRYQKWMREVILIRRILHNEVRIAAVQEIMVAKLSVVILWHMDSSSLVHIKRLIIGIFSFVYNMYEAAFSSVLLCYLPTIFIYVYIYIYIHTQKMVLFQNWFFMTPSIATKFQYISSP
jgi:hypothetical protein